MPVNNRWVRASGSLQDKPISIQFREDWQLAMNSEKYSICVQIAWHASSIDDSNGFPSIAEQARIVEFTELLQTRLEISESAIVTMMITHDSINQWIIYSSDLEKLQSGLDSIPTNNGLYPIEIVADNDPGWSTFTQVYQRIQPEATA